MYSKNWEKITSPAHVNTEQFHLKYQNNITEPRSPIYVTFFSRICTVTNMVLKLAKILATTKNAHPRVNQDPKGQRCTKNHAPADKSQFIDGFCHGFSIIGFWKGLIRHG